MSRKLKTLLLATMAMTAVAAFSAASAQAASTEFLNVNSGNTTVTATPDGTTGPEKHSVLDTPPGTITCSTVDLDGTTSVASSENQTLNFEYTNCRFQGLPNVIKAEGCAYVLIANGTVAIECPTSKTIKFEAAGCVVNIGAQSSLSGASGAAGVTYANINSSTEITASPNLVSIDGTASGCASGNGAFTNGSYTTGNVILTGEPVGGGAMKPIRVN
jgi:hypothetical protein